jgi:kanamycin kinase
VSSSGDCSGVPDKVAELAGTGTVELVWRNELGGTTFRLTDECRMRYIKWQPDIGLDPARRADVDLIAEAEKLRWAGRFVPVPGVLDCGSDSQGAWLITEAIDATPAFADRWRANPEAAVRAIATGLRRLHDALPVAGCPYGGSWCGPVKPGGQGQLVVCHGDPCVPNTLLDHDGAFAAHVDLARLGVADRWSDLAIATYSISWDVNFGRSYDDLFFEVYGVQPDIDRIRFYRELWDAE